MKHCLLLVLFLLVGCGSDGGLPASDSCTRCVINDDPVLGETVICSEPIITPIECFGLPVQ